MRQYAERILTRGGIAYAVAHVASGVAGLQLALAAGLGVACLNESALAPGIARLDAPDLPALPQAAFRVLPARPGEDAFVARARGSNHAGPALTGRRSGVKGASKGQVWGEQGRRERRPCHTINWQRGRVARSRRC